MTRLVLGFVKVGDTTALQTNVVFFSIYAFCLVEKKKFVCQSMDVTLFV